jgi:hypothetical protein
MWVKALRRFCRLLLVVVYAAATLTAAASRLLACPTLGIDHHSHAGHAHNAAHDGHGEHPTSQPGECLNCCIGSCLLGASLLPTVSGMASSAFYGARIVYPSEEVALANRSIPPDPAPPKPIS